MANVLIWLTIILGLGYRCDCLRPRLNVTDEFVVDNRTEGLFSIRCEGTEKLSWNWTSSIDPLDTTIVDIKDELHKGTDYPHVSTLTINEPWSMDSGFYYCHYEDVEDYASEDDKVASTYVYVFDGEGLVYDSTSHVTVSTEEKLVIDCRPTMPNITVTLTKNGDEVPKDRGLQFEPKIGYTLNKVELEDDGFYFCRSSNPVTEKVVRVSVITSNTAERKLDNPAIEIEKSQHFVAGHSFTINCSLLTDEVVEFHWEPPNLSVKYELLPEITDLRMNRSYRVRALHVANASVDDSGVYKCQVTASGKTPNEVSRKIVIKDSLDPYVEISGVSIISISEMEPVNWKAVVRAFPPNPEIIYRNWKLEEVEESSRITTEHHIGDAVSWLRIQNISAADFGNYTLEAIIEPADVRESKTILIEVKSKPYPDITGMPNFTNEGKQLNASCKTRGFPVPNVTWSFQVCPEATGRCSGSFDTFKSPEAKSSILPPGNVIESNISVSFNESGFLRCQAENEYGLADADFPISISDIGGNLVLRISRQGNVTEVTNQRSTLDIVVNDPDFEVMCGSTKFFYKTAALKLLGSGLKTLKNETKFSRKEWITSPKVTKAMDGRYQCSATKHNERFPVTREIDIRVHDEKRVTFVNSNMDPHGTDFEMIENEPFYLNCTVSGTPTPRISWFKDDEPLLPSSEIFDGETVFLRNNSQIIYFKYVFKENTGVYSCSAENRLNKIMGYLTITTPRPGLSAGAKAALGASVVGIAVLILVVVYLVKRVKKERKFRKSFRQNELYLFEKGNIGQLNPDCTADEQAELLPYDPLWEVERDNIKIGKQLGSGAFGRVVKAVVSGLEEDKPQTTVAVKMCKSQADQSQVRALALELKIMIHLGKHLNIVNLMGANTVHIGKGELWILVEYCRFGNLLSFMHRHRNKFINQIDPDTGKIDFMKVTQEGTLPFSPIGSSRGYQSSVVTDAEGYLAPTASKFNLASPPQTRHPNCSSPETPTSVTGPVNGIRPHVDNPMYNMLLQRSVSEHPDGESAERSNSGGSTDSQNAIGKQRLNSITSLERERRNRMDSVTSSSGGGKQRLNSTSHSDTGSVGYVQGHTTNTDMTTVPNSLLSPLSPTDSSHASDFGLDSKGNPFVYDAGIVPAVTAPFTTSDLVCWAWQVAQGMDYLSQRKVLHGDLAARNLLLADDNVIKISDFGLSREMYKKDVYMKKGDDLMPIKWMAVEAIRDRIFSVQSDVWAYGVTLWEIFTLGSTPYPGIEVNKDFLKLIEEGYRMDQPKWANRDMYDIIHSCWESDPRCRPSFAQAADQLGNLMQPDLRGHYMDMNDPYLLMNEERFRDGTDYLNMLASPNFDNLNREDDSRLHYVNVGDVPDGSRDSNYLDMKSPNSVGYSRVGYNNSLGDPQRTSSTATQKSHYLPMSAGQTTPSPLADVFSPRPNEVPRFTFTPHAPPGRLTDLPEEEETTSQRLNRGSLDESTEISSLIRSPSSPSKENAKNEMVENSPPLDENGVGNNSFYVNLPTHGTNYANL